MGRFNIFAPWNLCGHCIKLQVEAYAQEANLSDEDFGEVQSKQFFTSLLCRCRKKTKRTIPCWTSTSHRVHFLLGKLTSAYFSYFRKICNALSISPNSYNTLRRNDDNMQSNISHIPHISRTYSQKSVCGSVELDGIGGGALSLWSGNIQKRCWMLGAHSLPRHVQ